MTEYWDTSRDTSRTDSIGDTSIDEHPLIRHRRAAPGQHRVRTYGAQLMFAVMIGAFAVIAVAAFATDTATGGRSPLAAPGKAPAADTSGPQSDEQAPPVGADTSDDPQADRGAQVSAANDRAVRHTRPPNKSVPGVAPSASASVSTSATPTAPSANVEGSGQPPASDHPSESVPCDPKQPEPSTSGSPDDGATPSDDPSAEAGGQPEPTTEPSDGIDRSGIPSVDSDSRDTDGETGSGSGSDLSSSESA